MSGINNKVIYFGNDRKVIRRKEFLKQLSHELVLPQLLRRSELTLGMPLNLQNKLKIYQTPGNDEHEEPETTGMKRKRCEDCAGPGNKRKLTKYNCKKFHFATFYSFSINQFTYIVFFPYKPCVIILIHCAISCEFLYCARRRVNALRRSSSNNIDMQWNRLKKTINKVCQQNLDTTMNIKKKRWMATEILELMEKRRLAKNEQTTYRLLQNSIKGKLKLAKEKWINE
ncbi:hypothetical protein HHI36_018175 [Cryptolaemus montrouzieri]|uniref:Uncharacterized protein n=1 Tax=Cryptolaemus montrouzieri TaxID=559131 RepID=A0ABD2NZ98_9CUCU